MKFNPYNPLDELKGIEELSHQRMEQFQNSIPALEYEDTLFKEMADDIKLSQKQLGNKIDVMIEENAKSDKSSSRIAVWTLIIAILTLIATIAGIFVNFL